MTKQSNCTAFFRKLLVTSAVAAVCYQTAYAETTPSEPTQPTTTIADPYEGFNRAMFSFNDALDTYFMKPVATFYNKVMPKPLNRGFHNAFNNINSLPTIANDILQLHFYQMANDVWRLGLNTTVGILGFFDFASTLNLKYYKNDFGLTLAYYGYDNSNYLVLPFFGPNTLRDGIGIPVDYFAFSLYPHIYPESSRYQVWSWNVLDRRADMLTYQNIYDEAAVDKYTFMRSAYMQNRAYLIEQNQHLDAASQLANKPVTVN